jgi:putative DNA primase/helicase
MESLTDNVVPLPSGSNPGRKTEDYRILGVKEFLEIEVERDVVILDPLIRKGSIIMVTGSSGVGKTMFTLGICKSIVNGVNFGNWEPRTRTKVLYVDGELPTYVLQQRVGGFDIGEGFYILSSSLDKDKSVSLVNGGFKERVMRELTDRNIEVCVFDNISSLCPGLDENSKRDWDSVNQYFLELRRNGITTIFLHHTTKSKKEQRGTSGRIDNIDIWCNLMSLKDPDPETLRIKLTKGKGRFENSHLLDNLVFKMKDYNWTLVNGEEELTEGKITVLRLIGEGNSQRQIKDTLGKSQPYISKVRRELIGKGYLDRNNHPTEKGIRVLERES